jgi:hypothetical protein
LVRLQTQYKEETYKNIKIVRELKQGSEGEFKSNDENFTRPSLRRTQSFQPGMARPGLRRDQSIQQSEVLVPSILRSDNLRRIQEHKRRKSTQEEQKEIILKEFGSVSDDQSPCSAITPVYRERRPLRRTKSALADRYRGGKKVINLHDYATETLSPSLLDRSPSLRRLTARLPSWR